MLCVFCLKSTGLPCSLRLQLGLYVGEVSAYNSDVRRAGKHKESEGSPLIRLIDAVVKESSDICWLLVLRVDLFSRVEFDSRS